MTKIVNKTLVDLDGAVIKQQTQPGVIPGPDAPDLTVARVLINAALSQAQGQPYSPEKNVERYDAALTLNKTSVDGEIDLSVELLADLKKDVVRLYAPLVVGPMIKIIEGK